MVHQVGDTRDRPRLDGQAGDQQRVGLRRRRHRDRVRVVDVVGEAHAHATIGRATHRVPDDARVLLTECEVVVREVERTLGAVDEFGDVTRDLARLLPAVRQSSDLDALAH